MAHEESGHTSPNGTPATDEANDDLRDTFLQLLLDKAVRLVELKRLRERVDELIKKKKRKEKAATSDGGKDEE